MKSLREPEMIKNMDNMHLAAETMQNTSKKIESSIQEIKRTGVFEAAELLRVARENKSSMSEITTAVKKLQVSITALRNELR